MLRRRVICIYLGILAAWLQFLAPVAARSMERAADPLGIVCGRSAADKNRETPPVRHVHHDACCVCCHGDLGAAPLGERPVFTAFDYPLVSPLRWQVVGSPPLSRVWRREGLPRGPPTLV